MGRLEGKVAAVTGGAAGIGEATVRRFVEEGARVAFCDWNEALGPQVESELSGQAAFVRADVSQEAQAKALVDTALDRFGRLDVLVNNAGIRYFQDVTEASEETWDRILGVNLKGYAFCAKAAIPAMRDAGAGVIVNLASVRSYVAGPRMVQYDTTKSAILGLTRSMARDHAPDNIRVVAVGPGPVFTAHHENLAKERGQTHEEYRAIFGEDTMMKRPGMPREIANAILFLASDEASFVTGTCLMVDGGQTAL